MLLFLILLRYMGLKLHYCSFIGNLINWIEVCKIVANNLRIIYLSAKDCKIVNIDSLYCKTQAQTLYNLYTYCLFHAMCSTWFGKKLQYRENLSVFQDPVWYFTLFWFYLELWCYWFMSTCVWLLHQRQQTPTWWWHPQD